MSDPAITPPRPVLDYPHLAEQAAEFLRMPSALSELTAQEARCVVRYMRALFCPAGMLLIREGDQETNGYMLLVLDGEVTVESTAVSRTSPVIMSVLGPGSLIGEMGLLDGAPRAASCIATTPVTGAGLSRRSLTLMMRDEPAVAAKLLAAICQRMAERLRDSGRQQRVYGQLVKAMQGEIESLERQLQLVMSGRVVRGEGMESLDSLGD